MVERASVHVVHTTRMPTGLDGKFRVRALKFTSQMGYC